jgi:hypothetical protein
MQGGLALKNAPAEQRTQVWLAGCAVVTRSRAGRSHGAAGGAAPGAAPAPAPAGAAPVREAPAAVAHALARLLPALAGLDLPCFLHMLGSRRARWTRPRPVLTCPGPALRWRA